MIKFVGSAFVSGTSNAARTSNLQVLTGGIDTSARAGDFVLAITGSSNNGTSGVGNSGVSGVEYTTLFTGFANDNLDAACGIRYKYLTAADATALHFSNGLTTRGMAGIVCVFRGVNPTTPFNGSGVVASTNTGRPVRPAITPTIPGSWVIGIGVGTGYSGIAFGGHLVSPTGFTSLQKARCSGTVVSGAVNIDVCYQIWSGYTAVASGAWTSGSVSSRDSALGFSLSLNPETNKNEFIMTNF